MSCVSQKKQNKTKQNQKKKQQQKTKKQTGPTIDE